MTAIDWDADTAQADADIVVEGPGDRRCWRQTTQARGGRFYEDIAPGCELAPATDERFTSLTHLLRTCHPTDFTGPTKYNVARAAVHEMHEWTRILEDLDAPDVQGMAAERNITPRQAAEILATRWLADQAAVTLQAAADRGSAIHRAIEARLTGGLVDHDDLERNGAAEYLPAVDAFLLAAKPEPQLTEAVAYGRDTGTACTLDYFGSLFGRPNLVTDWKSRTSSHDRRTKEAAQLGGIIAMARDGYYFDERGRRRQAEVEGCGIVTFCPDGTWAWHEVDVDVALGSWHTALAMRPYTLISETYAKARKGEALDIGAVVWDRLNRIPDGTPQRMALMADWRQHQLPPVKELTLEHWATVDRLLSRAEPFPERNDPPADYPTVEEVAEVARRLAALPVDLAESVRTAGATLPSLDGVTLTADDLADWERLVTPAESTVEGRRVHIEVIVDQVPEAMRDAFFVALPELGEVGRWTEADIERAAELLAVIEAGEVILGRDGGLIVSPRVIEDLPKNDTKAKAREIAEAIGRPKPTRFDAVMNDVVLYAATREALRAEQAA